MAATRTKSWLKQTRRWFAYGLALDRTTTAAWSSPEGARFPELKQGSPAQLDGHALFFTGRSPRFAGRVPTLGEAPGQAVHGLLYELDDAQWAQVEAFERALGGERRTVKVRSGGQSVDAIAFVSGASRAIEIDESYLAAWMRGLVSAQVPKEWLQARAAEALVVEQVQKVGRERGLLAGGAR